MGRSVWVGFVIGLALVSLAGCAALPDLAQTVVPEIAGGNLPFRPTASPFASTPQDEGVASVCTVVYPLDQIEAIDFQSTTFAQLEAAFGAADMSSGRPARLRFERQGCVMLATMGMFSPEDIELLDYGMLGLLVERYGLPAGAGVAEGNLALPTAGVGVLFYPERGIIAIFDAPLEALTPETSMRRLIFRPPYDLEDQVTRLKIRLANWQPSS